MGLFNKKQPTNEEQMKRRQSSPRPTANDEVNRMLQQMQGQEFGNNNSINGFRALKQPIGEKELHEATLILQNYKQGKANLEKRIVDNEQWYKLRHWECMRKSKKSEVEPVSGWLFNCIANKHADAMDNFPSPNVLPREEGDKAEAEMLTSILPVILDQNDFEKVYDEVWNYKLKFGTGVYGVFWDSSKLNGLGDITIKKVDIINLFWESGITDIQKSRNLFHTELCDNDILESKYPQLQGKLSTPTVDITNYTYDDSVDTTKKSVVIDWYYKKINSQGKQILHYCKYVNNVLLFATENDPKFSETGFYDHGRYPFEFDPLFNVEGTPTGFGYIDIGKSAQEYIDRGNQAIMKNMLANASPRYFASDSSGINVEEYTDMTNEVVHYSGTPDGILPIQGKPLNDIYVTVINNKIDELKETTGNRDVSTGGATSGVTAASAIAAMQEAGSKMSRDSNKASYRVFRQICLLVIELIRQFYDMPRCFRIMGQNGVARFVKYSNQGILPQMQGKDFGLDMGMRIPLFDIEVTAEKQSPYSKMAQNELALQFYKSGFFNPQFADQSLACLDMMDFDRKEFIMQKIAQNGGMYQQMIMMQQQMMKLAEMLDAYRGGNEITNGLIQQFGTQMPLATKGNVSSDDNKVLGESSTTKKARQKTNEATSPI